MTKTKKPNNIVYQDEKEIHLELNKGKVLIIDAEDYDRIKDYRWCAHSKDDQWRVQHTSNKGSPTNLARYIMNAPKGMMVDHINHNTLDNRKRNLRICTALENAMNKRVIEKETSRYKGVSKDKEDDLYKANIRANNKQIFLGAFKLEVDAALAYNEAAIKYHKEFACLNDVDIPEGFASEYTVDGSYLKYRDKYWRKNRKIVKNEVSYQGKDVVLFKVGRKGAEYECIVDADTYNLIKDRFWEYDVGDSAVVERIAGKKQIRLSKVLLPHEDEEFVIHSNGNKLDHRIANLSIKNMTRNEVVHKDDKEAHIRLFNDKIFKIDAMDLDRVIEHKWCVDNKDTVKVYSIIDGNKVNIRKYLFNYGETLIPYHRNRDRLDFRAENMEFLTYVEHALKVNPRKTFDYKITYKDEFIAKIEITADTEITIDRNDLERVIKYRWKFNKRKGYFETDNSPYTNGITLQRFIINDSTIRRVEFISTNRTDFRRSNLRCRM